jgi:hypothetical protein
LADGLDWKIVGRWLLVIGDWSLVNCHQSLVVAVNSEAVGGQQSAVKKLCPRLLTNDN